MVDRSAPVKVALAAGERRRPPRPSRSPARRGRSTRPSCGHLADGETCRPKHGSGPRPARRARRSPGRRREPRSSAGRMPAAKTTRSVSSAVAVGQLDPQPTVVLPVVDRVPAPVWTCTPRPDVAPRTAPPPVVDLQRHEPRGELHDVRRQAHQHQRVGRLEPEQPTSDHEPVRRASLGSSALHGRLGRATDPVEVIQRAIHEAAGGVVTGHGRHEGVRTGCQDQLVVADDLPGLRRDGHCSAVEASHPGAQPEVDEVVSGIRAVGERERATVPRADVGGQADPVVCR